MCLVSFNTEYVFNRISKPNSHQFFCFTGFMKRHLPVYTGLQKYTSREKGWLKTQLAHPLSLFQKVICLSLLNQLLPRSILMKKPLEQLHLLSDLTFYHHWPYITRKKQGSVKGLQINWTPILRYSDIPLQMCHYFF